jgi:biotin carboxyl carrier protein
MHKSFRISVDGRAYHVVVDELQDDGTHVNPAVAAPLAPVDLIPSPPPPPAPVAASQPAAAGDEAAPLAGVVMSIDVKVGQVVAVGERIAIIEAMKMKTEIFAKRAGTVTAIAVKAHDTVDTGQALLTIG